MTLAGAGGSLSARLVVVDDEPATVRLLERLLAGWGYSSVVGTSDSAAALDLCRGTEPDLILLDLQMPPPAVRQPRTTALLAAGGVEEVLAEALQGQFERGSVHAPSTPSNRLSSSASASARSPRETRARAVSSVTPSRRATSG